MDASVGVDHAVPRIGVHASRAHMVSQPSLERRPASVAAERLRLERPEPRPRHGLADQLRAALEGAALELARMPVQARAPLPERVELRTELHAASRVRRLLERVHEAERAWPPPQPLQSHSRSRRNPPRAGRDEHDVGVQKALLLLNGCGQEQSCGRSAAWPVELRGQPVAEHEPSGHEVRMLHEEPAHEVVAIADPARLARARQQQEAGVLDATRRKHDVARRHLEPRLKP